MVSSRIGMAAKQMKDKDVGQIAFLSLFWSKSSWWFQPIWKILVKMGIFPQIGVKIKNIWNHHLVVHDMGMFLHLFKVNN